MNDAIAINESQFSRGMHLREIKEKFPEAFDKYIELLIEDCQDDFYVFEGRLYVDLKDESPATFLNPNEAETMTYLEGYWDFCETPE